MRPDVTAFIERERRKGEAFELPRDVEPFGENRKAWLAEVNERRAQHGRPPLANDEDGHPELTEKRREAFERFEREQAAESERVYRDRRTA